MGRAIIIGTPPGPNPTVWYTIPWRTIGPYGVPPIVGCAMAGWLGVNVNIGGVPAVAELAALACESRALAGVRGVRLGVKGGPMDASAVTNGDNVESGYPRKAMRWVSCALAGSQISNQSAAKKQQIWHFTTENTPHFSLSLSLSPSNLKFNLPDRVCRRQPCLLGLVGVEAGSMPGMPAGAGISGRGSFQSAPTTAGDLGKRAPVCSQRRQAAGQ